MDQNEVLATASINFGMTQVGKRESTGHNDGPFIDLLHAWYGTKNQGEPWCAMFCTWCIYQAAGQQNPKIQPKIKRTDSSSNLFQQASELELLLDRPIPNCIGLIRGNGGSPGKTHHHTFRVTMVNDSQGIVHSLDGNWGDAVSLTTHRMMDCDFMAVA